MVIHPLVQKHWHFQAYCKDRTEKIAIGLQKAENWFFSLTATEKMEYDRSRTGCSVIPKTA